MDDLERLNALDELMAAIYEVIVSSWAPGSELKKLLTIKGMLEKQVQAEETSSFNLWAEEVREESIFISIPVVGGGLYPIFKVQVQEWSTLYPAVDVEQELRKMVGWSKASPKQRKTRRGVEKFITGWLAKEQDRGGSHARFSGSKTGLFERFLKDGR